MGGRFRRAAPRLRLLDGGLQTAAPDDRVMARSLEWLSAQLAADVAGFVPVADPQRGRDVIVKFAGSALAANADEAYLAYAREYYAIDPFAPHRWSRSNVTVVGIRDIGGETAFATSRYGRFLRSYGVGSQVSIFLRAGERIGAAINLMRGVESQGFDRADLTFLQRVQPFLEQAYAFSCRSERPRPAALDDYGLTPRELEVARLVAAGASNAEIARALFVSVATVKTHLVHTLAKLGARSRTELVLRLAESGRAPSRFSAADAAENVPRRGIA